MMIDIDITTEDDAPVAATPSAAEMRLAPERAGRRVRRSVGLSAWALAAAFMPAVGATAALLLLVPDGPDAPAVDEELELAPLPEDGVDDATSSDKQVLPEAPNHTAAIARIEALASELDRLKSQQAQDARSTLTAGLEKDMARLFMQIRVARDERLKKGDRKNLAGPFRAEELEAVFADVGLGPDTKRVLTDREGNVVAPAGASLPEGLDLAADGRGRSARIWTLGEEDGVRTLVARACVYKEQHCLFEVATFDTSLTDVADLVAGLKAAEKSTAAAWARLGTNGEAEAAAVVEPTTAPQPGPSAEQTDADRRLAALVALLLACLASVGFGLTLVWRLRQATNGLTKHALDLARSAGRDQERWIPETALVDTAAAHDALEALGATAAELTARETQDEERRQRWRGWTKTLEKIARGQTDLRLTPDGDVPEETLAEGINRLLDGLQQRSARVRAHLGALQPGATAGSENNNADLLTRLDALRPLTSLLQDISKRARALSQTAPGEGDLGRDLMRLSEAVSARARAAEAILDGMETQLQKPLPSSDQSQALAALGEELAALGPTPRLPVVLQALQDLPSGGPEGPIQAVRGVIASS